MRKLWTEVLWLLILLALIAVMGNLLFSGNVLLFLSPRMVPMVWFGFVVLIVLMVFHASRILKSLKNEHIHLHAARLGVFLFVVPVVLFATVMPNQSTSGTLPNKNVKMMNSTASASGTDTAQAEPVNGYIPCVVEDEMTFFDTSADYFSDYLCDAMDEMVGRVLTVYGFVHFDDACPENTIMVSRMLIYCCAADACVVGFFVQMDDTSELEDNEWIRVTGTVQSVNVLFYGNYYDYPIFTNGMIVHCKEPDVDDAYVYP